MSEETERQHVELTPHQKIIGNLLLDLDSMKGFPDTPRKMRNITICYAEFASTEPYKAKDPSSPKNGVVPAVWLIEQIARSCEWFPSPILAREIYESRGYMPVDGKWANTLPQVCRRREPKDEE